MSIATCPTHGQPLIEIREAADPGTTTLRPHSTTKVYDSGAWTVETDGALESSGCFDKKELREIRTAVRHAHWKVTSSPIACFAYDPNFTQYLVHGRLRFTDRMCSGKTADSESMRAINLVKQDVAAAAATPPAPKCDATGTPLFEIRHRSDIAAPTSTVDIYESGAWTYQPPDKDGHAGTLATGCFDKPTTKSLRGVVDQSPWTTSFLRLVCRAYSPSFTEYYVHGTLEYTARMCGAQRLDDKSLGAIKIIEDQLALVLPPTT